MQKPACRFLPKDFSSAPFAQEKKRSFKVYDLQVRALPGTLHTALH